MALIAPQRADADGTTITYAAASASDTFAPVRGGVLLYRTSGTGSTLTLVVPGSDDRGQAKPDPAIVLGATVAVAIDAAKYVDAAGSTGLVTVTSTSQTGLTVAYVVA
jgi:hypothetical protein